MAGKKRSLTPFGLEVTIFCARNEVTCKEIADKAGVTTWSLSEVMRGKRSGTRKVIPSVRKVMSTYAYKPDTIAK